MYDIAIIIHIVQDFEKFKLGLVLADSKGHLLSSGLSLEFVYIIGNG